MRDDKMLTYDDETKVATVNLHGKSKKYSVSLGNARTENWRLIVNEEEVWADLFYDGEALLAYSIGANYSALFRPDINTSESVKYAASNFATMGFKSYYNLKPDAKYLKGNSPHGKPRIESTVLFFAGHANYDNMAWEHGTLSREKSGVYFGKDFISSTTSIEYAGLESYNLSQTDLMVFAGCLTASKEESSENLLTRAIDNGAQTAVGFPDSIGTSSASKWRCKFSDGLALGKTVLESINYANSFDYDDTLVRNATYEGNPDLILRAAPRGYSVTNEEISIYNFYKSIYYSAENNEYKEISEFIIDNVDESFKITDYKIDVAKRGNDNYFVTFTKMIGALETDIVYTFSIKEGYVSTISLHGNINYSIPRNRGTSNLTKSGVEQRAILSSSYKEGYTLVNQRIIEKYHTMTNEFKTIVISEFKHEDTNTFVAEEYTE